MIRNDERTCGYRCHCREPIDPDGLYVAGHVAVDGGERLTLMMRERGDHVRVVTHHGRKLGELRRYQSGVRVDPVRGYYDPHAPSWAEGARVLYRMKQAGWLGDDHE